MNNKNQKEFTSILKALNHDINRGAIWSWGDNTTKQAGVSGNSIISTPIKISESLLNFVTVGNGFGFAVADTGSVILGWGKNRSSEMGQGTRTDPFNPTVLTQASFKKVVSGPNTTLALLNDGSLWVWGNNSYNQHGDTDTRNSKLTITRSFAPAAVNPKIQDFKWIDISIGTYHVIAIRDDGTLWSWGGNSVGQCGNGTTTSIANLQMISSKTWTQVMCNKNSSYAIDIDGQIFAWGDNTYGQLGIDGFSNSNTPQPILTSQRFKTLAYSDWFSEFMVAITSENKLFGWGNNETKQIDSSFASRIPVPKQISDKNWRCVSIGGRWGSNNSRLGNTFAIELENNNLWGRGSTLFSLLAGKNTSSQTSDFVRLGTADGVFAGYGSVFGINLIFEGAELTPTPSPSNTTTPTVTPGLSQTPTPTPSPQPEEELLSFGKCLPFRSNLIKSLDCYPIYPKASNNSANYNKKANWNNSINPSLSEGSGNLTTVGTNGTSSYYGTYDQTGNVSEINDGLLPNSRRGQRGGSWASTNDILLSKNFRNDIIVSGFLNSESANAEYRSYIGFRLSSSGDPLSYNVNNNKFVTVGNSGNPVDGSTGFGSVSYNYKIMKYPVTNTEYVAFLNAVDPSGNNTRYLFDTDTTDSTYRGIANTGSSPTPYGVKSNMGNKPVNYISWFDAARFANWLHNKVDNANITGDAATEDGSYTLNGAMSGVITVNGSGRYRIPSEDEWYKAAYYNGSNAYRSYATQSDTLPTPVCADTVGNGVGCDPLPTPTATASQTPTPTITPSYSPTQSITPSNTSTPTITPTQSPTNTPTPSITPSNTPTPSITPSNTPTPSITPSNTPTPSITPSVTATVTATPSVTPTNTVTPSITPSVTASVTPTPTESPTATITPTITPTVTQTPTNTPTNSVTPSVTPSITVSPTNTASPTTTSTNTPSSTNTPTPTNTPTESLTPTPTPSITPGYSDNMDFIVSTSTSRRTIGITITTTGNSCSIYWGDGQQNDFTRPGIFTVNHTYSSNDTFILSITTGFSEININGPITHLRNWGINQTRKASFAGSDLVYAPPYFPSSITDASYMFDGCSKLVSLDTYNWDMYNVVSMQNMFSRCTALKSLNLPPFGRNWEAVNCTNFSNMFDGCTNFNDRVHFVTAAARNLSGMFRGCSSFNNPEVANFRTGNVTNFSSMFDRCTIFNQPLPWVTSSATTMNRMFGDATAFNQDLSTWSFVSIQNLNPSSSIDDGLFLFLGNNVAGAKFNPTNYRILLTLWLNAANAGIPSQYANAGRSVLSSTDTIGRQTKAALINKGWTIADGGGVST